MATKIYKTLYHVFTNNQDEWFANYDEAKQLYDTWAKEIGCARLYQENYPTKESYLDTMDADEYCLESEGDYPA